VTESGELKELASRLYVEMCRSPETAEALERGDEPGELYQELARRAIAAARTFVDELNACEMQ